MEENTMIERRYGMRLRGFAPGCQPKEGFIRREDDITGRYYDILVYDRRLLNKERRDYELDEIIEPHSDLDRDYMDQALKDPEVIENIMKILHGEDDGDD